MGKDGETGELFIVQARPETVKARSAGEVERYVLKQTARCASAVAPSARKSAPAWYA